MSDPNGSNDLMARSGGLAGYLVAGGVFAMILWSVIRTILLHA